MLDVLMLWTAFKYCFSLGGFLGQPEPGYIPTMDLPEQKRVSDLAEHLGQYTNPRYLVFYVFADTLAVAQASINIHSPFKCVSGELYSSFQSKCKTYLI